MSNETKIQITLIKSLNGRHEKHIATANSLVSARSMIPPFSRTTKRPAARLPRSATLSRLKTFNQEVRENETE